MAFKDLHTIREDFAELSGGWLHQLQAFASQDTLARAKRSEWVTLARQNPQYRERERQSARARRSTPEGKARHYQQNLQSLHKRMQEDPAVRERRRELKRKWRARRRAEGLPVT